MQYNIHQQRDQELFYNIFQDIMCGTADMQEKNEVVEI